MQQTKQKTTSGNSQIGGWILVGVLAVIFVIRFGILIEKSQGDLFQITQQIQMESNMIRQKSQIKVGHPTGSGKNTVLTTGDTIVTGSTTLTGN